MISTGVALAVLGSALMHAGWNFLVKAGSDRLLDTVAIAVGGSMLAALLLPFAALPHAASWPWLVASAATHTAYFVALAASYERADLSVAYPLMRGLAPVIVAVGAPLFGEPWRPGSLIGVGLIAAGIMIPALLAQRQGASNGKGTLCALVNSLIIAFYTVVDGIGVRLSGDAIAYTLWLFFLDAWGISAFALWYRGRRVLAHLRCRWRHALVGSCLTLGAYGIVLWAMTVAPISAVAALRETSVIFATLLGIGLLGDRMGAARAGGAFAVATGAVLIRLG